MVSGKSPGEVLDAIRVFADGKCVDANLDVSQLQVNWQLNSSWYLAKFIWTVSNEASIFQLSVGFDWNDNARLDSGEPRSKVRWNLGGSEAQVAMLDLGQLCPCRALNGCEDSLLIDVSIIDRDDSLWDGETKRVRVDESCMASVMLGKQKHFQRFPQGSQLAFKVSREGVDHYLPFCFIAFGKLCERSRRRSSGPSGAG